VWRPYPISTFFSYDYVSRSAHRQTEVSRNIFNHVGRDQFIHHGNQHNIEISAPSDSLLGLALEAVHHLGEEPRLSDMSSHIDGKLSALQLRMAKHDNLVVQLTERGASMLCRVPPYAIK
jgi:hypothetical protein